MRVYEVSAAAVRRPYVLAGANLAPGFIRQALLAMRARLMPLALLMALLMPGTVGHDPWKQDEAYSFGLILSMLETGDWVVPTLAGQPFMEKPPLFYISAAVTATLLSPWLPLHDGARLAATLWIAFGLLMTGLAARRLYGQGVAVRAMLYLVGSIGLLQHAHEMITDTALFAGFALAIYGLTFARVSAARAGSCIGTGVGIGFLSKGLVEPAMVGLACGLLPLASAKWRISTYASTLAIAALFALPWITIWPIALFTSDRQAFDTWFWVNNFGRFTGTAHLGANAEPLYYLRVLPWFTFPAGVIAVASIARAWRSGTLSDLRAMVPFAVVAGMLVVLIAASTVRSLYAMPLLIPLAIFASRERLPEARWIAIASAVFAASFALLAAGLWVVYFYAVAQGRPPAIDVLLRWLPADFEVRIQPANVAVALAVTGIWLTCWIAAKGADRHLYRWVAGLAMVWGTAMSLHLPWLDHAKSFRQPFAEMATFIVPGECVLESGLGEPQRGMLHYVAGLVASDLARDDGECRYLIVQTNHGEHLMNVPWPGWQRRWGGGRPGEYQEAFTLFERDDIDPWPIQLYASRDDTVFGVATE